MKKQVNKNSFQKGMRQIKNGDVAEIKKKILGELKLTSKMSWYNRLYGKTIPNKEEVEKIEKIFSKYGVTEVWGL